MAKYSKKFIVTTHYKIEELEDNVVTFRDQVLVEYTSEDESAFGSAIL